MSTEQTMQFQKGVAEYDFYTGPVDGVYGPDTEAAVKAFQKDDRLPATGEFDEVTDGTIDAAMKHTTARPSPSASPSKTASTAAN